MGAYHAEEVGGGEGREAGGVPRRAGVAEVPRGCGGERAQEVLQLLPAVPELDDEKYSKIRIKLEDDIGPAWLVHFVFGDDGASLDEKRIPSKIGRVRFGRVDCKAFPEACQELKIRKPQYVVFKVGGGFESVLVGIRLSIPVRVGNLTALAPDADKSGRHPWRKPHRR